MTFGTRGSDLREQLEKLGKCLAVVERLPRKQTDLQALERRVEGVKESVAATTAKRDEADGRYRAGLERLSLMERGLAESKADVERLRWLEECIPRQAALVREESDLGGRLTALRRSVEEAEGRERTLIESMDEQETERSDVLGRGEEAAGKLERARELLAGLDEWAEKRTRLGKFVAEKMGADESIEALKLSEKTLLETVEVLEEEKETLAERIEVQEERRGELSELVMRLESHIEGGVCPVCGEDHGNQEKLLDRIGEHLGEDIAKEERLRLEVIRRRVEEQNAMLDERAARRRKLDLRQRELERETVALDGAIQEYDRTLSEIGVAGGRSAEIIRGELEGLCSDWERVASEMEDLASQMWSQLEQLRRESHEVTERIHAIRGDVERAASEQERISAARQQMEADPRAQQEIGLDSPLESVVARRESVERELLSDQKSMEQERSFVVARRDALSVATLDLEGKESELATLLEEVAGFTTLCRDMEAMLATAGITDDENEDDVTRRMELLRGQVTANDALIGMITRVELVVDSATTKAAYSRLQGRVRRQHARLTELASSRELHMWWVDYFEELQRLLSSEQDKAVSRFAKEYGPRTSAIQRRLRSVYGFDDVEISSERSRISVRVLRRGYQLRPTDYFSQSQQQTLLLGLFLTASISQTWSAMAPVFLDDPVTHFDDLNTYAFLDLIDGLLNDREAGGRQFVISTCDERLLQLARQKFAYRNDGARFYAFKGIGEDGPVVEQERTV